MTVKGPHRHSVVNPGSDINHVYVSCILSEMLSLPYRIRNYYKRLTILQFNFVSIDKCIPVNIQPTFSEKRSQHVENYERYS